jgi:four helix bundle protein
VRRCEGCDGSDVRRCEGVRESEGRRPLQIEESAMLTDSPRVFGNNSSSGVRPLLAMGAKHFSELICWQLARALQMEVFKLSAHCTFNQDFKLRDQLRSAASSARSEIAEGFGRTTHRDFAVFLNRSCTSVNEVENRLGEAVDNGYLLPRDIATALVLCRRTCAAASSLRRVLKSTPDPPANRWPRRRPSR